MRQTDRKAFLVERKARGEHEWYFLLGNKVIDDIQESRDVI